MNAIATFSIMALQCNQGNAWYIHTTWTFLPASHKDSWASHRYLLFLGEIQRAGGGWNVVRRGLISGALEEWPPYFGIFDVRVRDGFYHFSLVCPWKRFRKKFLYQTERQRERERERESAHICNALSTMSIVAARRLVSLSSCYFLQKLNPQ